MGTGPAPKNIFSSTQLVNTSSTYSLASLKILSYLHKNCILSERLYK